MIVRMKIVSVHLISVLHVWAKMKQNVPFKMYSYRRIVFNAISASVPFI